MRIEMHEVCCGSLILPRLFLHPPEINQQGQNICLLGYYHGADSSPDWMDPLSPLPSSPVPAYLEDWWHGARLCWLLATRVRIDWQCFPLDQNVWWSHLMQWIVRTAGPKWRLWILEMENDNSSCFVSLTNHHHRRDGLIGNNTTNKVWRTNTEKMQLNSHCSQNIVVIHLSGFNVSPSADLMLKSIVTHFCRGVYHQFGHCLETSCPKC